MYGETIAITMNSMVEDIANMCKNKNTSEREGEKREIEREEKRERGGRERERVRERNGKGRERGEIEREIYI